MVEPVAGRVRTLGLTGGIGSGKSTVARVLAGLGAMVVDTDAIARELTGPGEYLGLKRLLSARVPPGVNRWMVGHGTPFRAVAGPPHLAQGEAIVLKPDGEGWTVLARLAVNDWAALPAR